MNTEKVLALARKYLDNKPENEASARLCLSDAVELYDAGDYEWAKKRALRSLAYSIGIGHPDYLRASK